MFGFLGKVRAQFGRRINRRLCARAENCARGLSCGKRDAQQSVEENDRPSTLRQKYGNKVLCDAAHKCNPIFDAQ